MPYYVRIPDDDGRDVWEYHPMAEFPTARSISNRTAQLRMQILALEASARSIDDVVKEFQTSIGYVGN